MAFQHWHAFLHMGGYAAYVWPAYAVVVVTALVMVWASMARLRRVKKAVRQANA